MFHFVRAVKRKFDLCKCLVQSKDENVFNFGGLHLRFFFHEKISSCKARKAECRCLVHDALFVWNVSKKL